MSDLSNVVERVEKVEARWRDEEATGIFNSIELFKREMAGFDWHEDDVSLVKNRDERFYLLKKQMDAIWENIKETRERVIDLSRMSEGKADKLLHYCNREPKQFVQFDVFTNVKGCDPIVQPDSDNDSMFCVITTELMTGNVSVRVLITPGTSQETVTRALRKISAWAEEEPELLCDAPRSFD